VYVPVEDGCLPESQKAIKDLNILRPKRLKKTPVRLGGINGQ
jgi:hypothetical protein